MLRRLLATILIACALAAPAGAAQNTLVTPGSPLTMAGLAAYLNNAYTTVGTNYSGPTAPGVFAGGTASTYQFWLDTSSSPRVLRINDGSQWVPIGTLDTTAHVFTIASAETPSTQAGASYTYTDGNRAGLIRRTNAGAMSDTLPQAGASSQFTAGWFVDVRAAAAGTVTITPTVSTIDGASSLTLPPGLSVRIVSDGTNYFTTQTLGTPTTAVLGGVFSKAAVASNWLRSLGTDGNLTASQPAFTDISGSFSCAQRPSLTGDVTANAGSCVTVLANIPTAVPMAGSLLATNIVAPGTPASGKTSIYVDSTDKRLHDKNDAGTVGTTVVSDTGAANNFLTAISVAGVISKARPTCANLSDSGAACTSSATITLNTGANVGITTPGAMVLGSTYTIGATTDDVRFNSLGLGVAAPTNGRISQTLGANNVTGHIIKRNTDTSPTGNFLDFQNAAGGSLFTLDITGTITAGIYQGTVINSTYGGTGVNNGGRTLTVNTNSGTLAFSAASKTLTVNQNLTLDGTTGKSLTLTNGLTVTTNDGTLAFGAASKTLTVNKSLTLDGTDGTTQTFPSTNATIARTDAAQTFTGVQTFGTPIALGSGGSGQATAAAARAASGFNIDSCTTNGDSNYTILSTDRCVYHTALSAARTDTLPAANSVNPGQKLVVNDFRGVVTASNTITLQRAGSDTINGATTAVALNSQYGWAMYMSDGVSRWTFQAGGGGGGGVTGVTAGNGLDGGTITTAGTISAGFRRQFMLPL